jgi:hypothetical protein
VEIGFVSYAKKMSLRSYVVHATRDQRIPPSHV